MTTAYRLYERHEPRVRQRATLWFVMISLCIVYAVAIERDNHVAPPAPPRPLRALPARLMTLRLCPHFHALRAGRL